MTFTTLTTQNQAVQQLVKTGAARLSGIGEATLAIPAGRYRFAFTVPLLASPAPEVTVRVYDSSSGDKAEVKVLTAAASIADYDSPDIASENRAFWRSHNNTKIGYSFEVELPEPTGEYVLRIDTGAATGQDGTALDLTWEHTYFPAIPDGTVVRDDLDDLESFMASRPTRAAYGGGQTRAVGAFGSLVWDASQDFAVEFRIASTVTPQSGKFLGAYGANNWNILIEPDGRVIFRNQPTVLLTAPAGTVTFDGTEQHFRIAFTGTAVTIFKDGAEVITGTAESVTWASATQHIAGYGSENRWPGTIRDVRLIDNTTPANSVTLLMDEPSGPYRNTYPSSTAAAYATRNGTVESRLVNTPSGTGALVASKEPARMRIAAHSGKANTAVNEWGSVSWAPASGTAWRWKWLMSSRAAPSSNIVLFGRVAANFANIRLSTAGIITVYASSTLLGTATVPIGFEGGVYECEARLTDTKVELWINGFKAINATVASQSWSTSAATNYLGASGPGGVAYNGALWNFEIIDENSLTTNSAVYLLDEDPRVATTYANSLAGSSVGAMTRNGFVSCCSVVSHDGRGATWQPGAGGPWVWAAERGATDQVMDGSVAASYIITFDGELDPNGALVHTTGIWTAPCAGSVRVWCDFRFSATGIASDGLTIAIAKAGSTLRGFSHTLTSSNLSRMNTMAATTVTAGQTIDVRVSDIDPTNTTLAIDYAALIIEFTPNVATG